MTDNDKELFPRKEEEEHTDDLSSAGSAHIQDDIEDSQSLRHWRPRIAAGMIVAAVAFYAVLLITIGCIGFCDTVAYRVHCAPTVAITIVLVLATVPTLIMLSVAKAVFGKRNSGDSPYTPLQAIIHLMKEMKGS